jgi:hypothetical protein
MRVADYRRRLVAVVWAAVVAVPLLGPGPAIAQSRPGTPELEKLQRYLGMWSYDGRDETPLSGGPVTCRTARRWIAGGLFVESHRDCVTRQGEISQVEIYGYDPRRGTYTYWGFNGGVASTYVTATIEGRTVIWTGIGDSAGNRCTEVYSDDLGSSAAQCESTRDGGTTWTLRSSGKAIKETVQEQ